MPSLVPPAVAAGRMRVRDQPVIQVGALQLRHWTPADAPSVVEAYADPDIRQWHARSMTLDEAALTAMTDWVFAELGLHRVEVAHSSGNPASCRVAERAGFAFEGVKRQQALHPDGWHDMHLHARLAADPRPASVSGQ